MSSKLRVLIVEDTPTDATLIARELTRAGHELEVLRVEDAEGMRAALASASWDAVISDWTLPRFSAHDALQVLREADLDLPFIIVSGTIGEETAVDAMRAGADDFVRKDNPARLAPALERELRDRAIRAAHRQETAARRSMELRFQRLAESGIIGVVLSEMQGNVLDANDAWLRMVGYTRDDLAKGVLKWTELTPPEFLHLGTRAVEQIHACGVAAPWETESFRKDGSRVPVVVGVAMLEYPTCIAFVVDLSNQRRAENAHEQAERALRRSEDQLRHAQKMEAVGRLAGGVAHDINNILSVIMSYAELTLEVLNPGAPTCAEISEIAEAARRAARLTRQLLLFSRHQIVEPKVLEPSDLLARMGKMIERLVGEDVEVTLNFAPKVGRVYADPGGIEQAVMNLVVNARDAMPRGGKLTIEMANVDLDDEYVATHLTAKPGRYVVLAVSDNGCGMDEATQARIFEPFFTTKEVGMGTGLGLSSVFGIVQQSGGSIWVYSEIGKGTTFKVFLPRVDAAPDEERPHPVSVNLVGNETVLLVEDDAALCRILERTLLRYGYRVLAAQSAGDALLLSERHVGPIHLLLTDVVLPQLSGPDLAARLAQARPELRMLCMSGYTEDTAVRHGLLASGVPFLSKPVTPALLARKVREVLGGPPTPRSPS